jgi:hypothetical protein
MTSTPSQSNKTDEDNVTTARFVPQGFGGPDFILTRTLVPVPLIRCEMRTLAQVDFHGFINHYLSRPSHIDEDGVRSLVRFGLVNDGHMVDGSVRTPGYLVSELGREILSMFRPERYGCRCEHAVQLPCFCTELTFCPNPEHSGNGCHGSHD